jgi:hypothetical protein
MAGAPSRGEFCTGTEEHPESIFGCEKFRTDLFGADKIRSIGLQASAQFDANHGMVL